MKFGKPNTKNTEKTLLMGGGAVAGAIASDVVKWKGFMEDMYQPQN